MLGITYMTDRMPNEHWSNWWLLLFVATGALVVFLPIVIYAFELGVILYTFIGIPVVSLITALVVLIIAIRNRETPRLPVFLMFPVYWLVSAVLFVNAIEVRAPARWILESENYKSKVLAQRAPPSGELKHVIWDGWGWDGNDTDAYLVFDPDDSLASAARRHSPGKFAGIPCEVWKVLRLERHWYSVVFYTNTGWDCCNW